MSITGSGTISSSLDSPGLIWTSYDGYFGDTSENPYSDLNDNVNYFSTATTRSRGTTTDLTNVSTGTNGVWGVNANNNYSIQWLGYFLAPLTGRYTWGTISDDASYLWIGPTAKTGYTKGNATVNNGMLHGMQLRTGTSDLIAGVYYPIRIQFGELGGDDNMQVYFKLPGSSIDTYNGTGYYFNDGTLLDGILLNNPLTTVIATLSFTTTVAIWFASYTAFSNDGYSIYQFNSSQVFSYSSIQSVVIYYLVVGGGGSGGRNIGGGGGGGQVVYGSYTLPSTNGVTVNCSVTVGNGGAVYPGVATEANNNGKPSNFVINGTTIATALGGGFGGNSINNTTPSVNGYNGGGSTLSTTYSTLGGNAGGAGSVNAGGGGGAGGVGGAASTGGGGGAGGIGVVCPTNIKGISTYFGNNIFWGGGGGGGGSQFASNRVGGRGGKGGGGGGGYNPALFSSQTSTTSYMPTDPYGNSDITGNPASITALTGYTGGTNTGGGGGGGYHGTGNPSSAGGSGIVVLAFPGFNNDILSYSYYTFNYTGADQTFTIPTLAKSVTIQCWGAGGATKGYGANNFYNTGYGGGGGFTQAVLNSSNAGQTLTIIVGQGGLTANNGASVAATYGGGGGVVLGGDTNWGSASGGGRSAVRISTTEIVTAGGGGGGGGWFGSSFSSSNYGNGSGGPGGGTIGGNAYVNSYGSMGGQGGSQSSGGAKGFVDTGIGTDGTNGSQYTGGNGAQYGTGGGGGYYGGGGGGITYYADYTMGGGGGGSSYVNPSYATSQYILQGSANLVAGSTYLPSGVSNIGNGAAQTNTLYTGANGYNGLVVITVAQ